MLKYSEVTLKKATKDDVIKTAAIIIQNKINEYKKTVIEFKAKVKIWSEKLSDLKRQIK